MTLPLPSKLELSKLRLSRPLQPRLLRAKPLESKPPEPKLLQSKPPEPNPSESKPPEPNPSESKPLQSKLLQSNALIFGPLLAKPLPKPPTEPMPEWVNLGFAVFSLIALVLGLVWLIRRGGFGGGPPWRR
jgi:hypothetical protein